MAKNFATIYNDTGDSSAQIQSFFIKEETVRGTFAVPVGTDFLFTLSGGSTNFSQPKFSSPHRSGRSHLGVIREKTETSFSIPTYFNIDTTLGAAAAAEVDLAYRWLHKSLFGTEDLAAGALYSAGTPDTTATILENGDKFSKQTVGCFIDSATMEFPGDGQANSTWEGMAKTSNLIGVAKATAVDHGGANTIILTAGEGVRMRVGGVIMLIEADGLTRSADTPDGAPRNITSLTGDTIIVDGAVLADANGTPGLYCCYYEPENIVGTNDPQVGLEGSLTFAGFSGLGCFRSASLSFSNNHTMKDNCYGEEGLGGALFTPGGRFDISLSAEINMNHELLGFLNTIRDDDAGQDIQLILGDATTRHLQIDMDRVIFSIPEVSIPESGDIPVTLESAAIVQSAIDAQDEIQLHYK